MSIKCVLYVRWYDDAVNLYIYLGTMSIELNSVVNVKNQGKRYTLNCFHGTARQKKKNLSFWKPYDTVNDSTQTHHVEICFFFSFTFSLCFVIEYTKT